MSKQNKMNSRQPTNIGKYFMDINETLKQQQTNDNDKQSTRLIQECDTFIDSYNNYSNQNMNLRSSLSLMALLAIIMMIMTMSVSATLPPSSSYHHQKQQQADILDPLMLVPLSSSSSLQPSSSSSSSSISNNNNNNEQRSTDDSGLLHLNMPHKLSSSPMNIRFGQKENEQIMNPDELHDDDVQQQSMNDLLYPIDYYYDINNNNDGMINDDQGLGSIIMDHPSSLVDYYLEQQQQPISEYYNQWEKRNQWNKFNGKLID